MSGAPKESAGIQRLIEVYQTTPPDSVRARDVIKLFRDFHIPGNLRALGFWAQRFIEIVAKVSWVGALPSKERRRLEAYLRACTWLSGLSPKDLGEAVSQHFHFRPVLAKQSKDEVARGDPPRYIHPLSGHGITIFSAYSVVLCRSENPVAEPIWCEWVLTYLLAHAEDSCRHVRLRHYAKHEFRSRIDQLPDDPYPASRVLREMSHWGMDLIPELGIPLPDSLQKLRGSIGLVAENEYEESLDTYARYVLRAYEVRRRKRRGHESGGKRERSSRGFPGYVDLGEGRAEWDAAPKDDDEDALLPTKRIQFGTKGMASLESDEAPTEDFDPRALDLLEHKCVDTLRSAASVALSAIGRQNATKMGAQDFGWRVEGLTMEEALRTHTELGLELERLLAREPAMADDAVADTLVLLLVLWTGVDPKLAAGVYRLEQSKEETRPELGLYQNEAMALDGSAEWKRVAVVPSQGSQALSEALSRRRRDSVWIPDLFSLWPLVMRVNALPWRARKRLCVLPDVPDDSILHQRLQRRLREVSSDPNRVTLNKLTRYVEGRVMALAGDVTVASLICARVDPRADSRLHYSLINMEHLRRVYIDSMEPEALLVGRPQEWIDAQRERRPKKTWFVGAWRCLTTSGFQALIKSTLETLERTSAYSDLPGFIEFHNAYTAYTVWLFQTAIAGRANKDPFLEPEDVDPGWGISTIRDKDYSRPYHARLVWIPKPVLMQLRLYKMHRKRVEAELLLRGQSPQRAAGFYLTESMKRQDMSTSLWRAALGLPKGTPHNAHRRYMRTELVERGCPVESVDAMLGHWALGEEPWAPESSFDFSRHIEMLQRHVGPILDELGWKLVASPLVTGRSGRWRQQSI